MKLSVWTSTPSDSVDYESEEGFFESGGDTFARVVSDKLDAVDMDSDSAMKMFKVIATLQVPSVWLEKYLPFLLKISETSMDIRLRHVHIEYKDGILYTSAITPSRAIRMKNDISIDAETGEVDIPNFSVIVSTEQAAAMLKFVSKAFGAEKVEIGIKEPSSDGMLDNILVKFRGSVLKGEDKKVPKHALIRLDRSTGELPMDIFEQQPMLQKFSAKILPTLRWAFSNKKDYIEFIPDESRVLGVQFQDDKTDSSVVRASLGAPLSVHPPESKVTPGSVLACADGKYLADIFNFVKSQLTMEFGYVDGDPDPKPSFMYLYSEETDYVLGQSHEQISPADVDIRYVTHKKNKVVEATQEEATERALKQNKSKLEDLEQPDPVIDVSANELQMLEREVSIAKKSSTVGLEKIVVMLEETLTALKRYLDATQVQVMSSPLPTQESKSPPKKEATEKSKPAATPVDTPPFPEDVDPENLETFSIDVLANFLEQFSGLEVDMKIIKESLDHLSYSTLSGCVFRLKNCNVIGKMKRGTYFIPVNFRERYEHYKEELRPRSRKGKAKVGDTPVD